MISNGGEKTELSFSFSEILYGILSVALCGCAASPGGPPTAGGTTTTNTGDQSALEAGLMSARVQFDYINFFTLTSPNPGGCAGDARNFFDPLALQSVVSGGTAPTPYATDVTNSSATIRPSFIKNISVDVTDSNSIAPSNLAIGCSYGSGLSTPAASACAAFDYAADGGVTSDLSGSILLFGGIQNTNYAGIQSVVVPSPGLAISCGPILGSTANSCATSIYALGVDSLPASSATDPPNSLVPGLESATTSISSFVNLAAATSYSGPQEFAGATGAYDLGDTSFMMFGGSSVVLPTSATGQATTSDVTWTFNVTTQTWNNSATPNAEVDFQGTIEVATGTRTLSNVPTGRWNFGYTPVQGLSLSSMGSVGVIPTVAGAPSITDRIDHSDRIVIAGGEDGGGYASDSFKLNPTYGPEWIDALGRATSGGSQPPAAGEPVQWLESYFLAPMYNTSAPAELKPSYLNSGTPVVSSNFGLAPLRDNSAVSTYGSGYALFMGGFDTSQVSTLNPSLESCAAAGTCGMMIFGRTDRGFSTGPGAGEQFPANFSSVGNLSIGTLLSIPTIAGPTTQIAPSVWNSYLATTGVPFFGGSSLLPGFDLNTNDVVFFGGSTCGNYLLTANACVGASLSFANPGTYFVMGQDPMQQSSTVPANVGFNGTTPPHAAGMAAARGADPSGNPVIVAFGGMGSSGTLPLGTSTTIYYLYNSGGTFPATPKWGTYVPTNTSPAPVANGTLVYSHVTKSFYLFGGYSPISGAPNADTWKLSLSTPGCGTTGACSFQWTQLNITGGLTCTPNCAALTARHSHRMVEVNYFNRNPGGTVGGVVTGEPTCSDTQPCSYSIFMEGGTANGTNPLSDRWIFDPTANSGFGVWQQIRSDFPGRTLASTATADYALPFGSGTAHRAVMFGGEMGMADPVEAATGEYFVPPTLGDTWMFDYDKNIWNRVTLLGRGYNGPPVLGGSGAYILTENDNRQAYDATNPSGIDSRSTLNNMAELSPPPTSGAIMITRTLSGPTSNSGTPASPLRIPEIYMIGGRLKDGSYQTFDHVYKFCSGSTGEAYTGAIYNGIPDTSDLSCDAYDPNANPNSLSPSNGYVGRWLRKQPAASNTLSSFMGAGAYDSANDLIEVYGGLSFVGGNTAVTDTSANRGVLSASTVYEYSAPSVGATQGTWNARAACVGSPTPIGRYGHSMAYNSQHQELVIIGGYDLNGDPLVQNLTYYDGQTYTTPDMWAATRSTTGGITCYQWRQLSTIGNYETAPPPVGGLSHMIAAYVPSQGYNTGYYSTFDSACDGVGPIATTDPNVSKLLAGGAYFDIDRTQLGPNENVLLNLTFIPLGQTNQGSNVAPLTAADNAIFKIHLVVTGQAQQTLETTQQPRFLTYTGNSAFPEIVQSLSVISPPTGQVRQEQILIPLTANPAIDRIRIERYSGTGILIDASLYRMGYK